MLTTLFALTIVGFVVMGFILIQLKERLSNTQEQRDAIHQLLQAQQHSQQAQREAFDQHQVKSLTTIQESLQKATLSLRDQVKDQIQTLTTETRRQLGDISDAVDKRLTKGFEKTTETFADVMKRLVVIDEAQKKITELSSDVVSLQAILSDKKSRGAFGEVQLGALIRNMMPESSYSEQHTLSNGKRCDFMLFLPEPTGNIVVDAKFPLETYQAMTDETLTTAERSVLETQFKKDIKKHIDDIATRYIIPGETAEGAVMFLPAEAIFAEIHAHYPELVAHSQRQHVWLVSPTTLMAILTTARAVLKDAATREQVHIIQEHLVALGKDFERFQKRMDNLARHINQANDDVDLVYKTSKKITSRFQKIDQVELALEQTNESA